MKERKGDFIQTFTGKHFYPLDVKLEDICIKDIAHALSNICRFTGHTSEFYSVAQHSYLVSDHLPDKFKFQGLLHDASEAYLCDIARPVKKRIKGYAEIEKTIQDLVYKKFNVKVTPESEAAVKEVDFNILGDEAKYLMNDPKDWGDIGKPLGICVQGWFPKAAEHQFWYQFIRLVKLNMQ